MPMTTLTFGQPWAGEDIGSDDQDIPDSFLQMEYSVP